MSFVDDILAGAKELGIKTLDEEEEPVVDITGSQVFAESRKPVTATRRPPRGLIQFIDSTARLMGYDSNDQIVEKYPTTAGQLAGPVRDYLAPLGPFRDEGDFYLSVFYPAARGMPLDSELPEHVQRANPQFKTVGDVVQKYSSVVGAGQSRLTPEEMAAAQGLADDLGVPVQWVDKLVTQESMWDPRATGGGGAPKSKPVVEMPGGALTPEMMDEIISQHPGVFGAPEQPVSQPEMEPEKKPGPIAGAYGVAESAAEGVVKAGWDFLNRTTLPAWHAFTAAGDAWQAFAATGEIGAAGRAFAEKYGEQARELEESLSRQQFAQAGPYQDAAYESMKEFAGMVVQAAEYTALAKELPKLLNVAKTAGSLAKELIKVQKVLKLSPSEVKRVRLAFKSYVSGAEGVVSKDKILASLNNKEKALFNSLFEYEGSIAPGAGQKVVAGAIKERVFPWQSLKKKYATPPKAPEIKVPSGPTRVAAPPAAITEAPTAARRSTALAKQGREIASGPVVKARARDLPETMIATAKEWEMTDVKEFPGSGGMFNVNFPKEAVAIAPELGTSLAPRTREEMIRGIVDKTDKFYPGGFDAYTRDLEAGFPQTKTGGAAGESVGPEDIEEVSGLPEFRPDDDEQWLSTYDRLLAEVSEEDIAAFNRGEVFTPDELDEIYGVSAEIDAENKAFLDQFGIDTGETLDIKKMARKASAAISKALRNAGLSNKEIRAIRADITGMTTDLDTGLYEKAVKALKPLFNSYKNAFADMSGSQKAQAIAAGFLEDGDMDFDGLRSLLQSGGYTGVPKKKRLTKAEKKRLETLKLITGADKTVQDDMKAALENNWGVQEPPSPPPKTITQSDLLEGTEFEDTRSAGQKAFDLAQQEREAAADAAPEPTKGTDLFEPPDADQQGLFGAEDVDKSSQGGFIGFSGKTATEGKPPPSSGKKAITNLMKGMTKEGELPKPVFYANEERVGEITSMVYRGDKKTRDMKRAVKNLGLSRKDRKALEFNINETLAGKYDIEKLPENVRGATRDFISYVKELERKLIDVGAIDGELAARIGEDGHFYLHRSYRMDDIPKWADKIKREMPDLWNKVTAMLEQEIRDRGTERILTLTGRAEALGGAKAKAQKKLAVPLEQEDMLRINERIRKMNDEIARIRERTKTVGPGTAADNIQSLVVEYNKVRTDIVDQMYRTRGPKQITAEQKYKIDDLYEEMSGLLSKNTQFSWEPAEIDARVKQINDQVKKILGDKTPVELKRKMKAFERGLKREMEINTLEQQRNVLEATLKKPLGERDIIDLQHRIERLDELIGKTQEKILTTKQETAEAITPERLEGLLRKMLDHGDVKGIFGDARKIGSKDLSILKKRSKYLDERAELRALMGEYKDPYVNFNRSIKKMASLIANTKFLDRVREEGLGSFLFKYPTGEYSMPIAADESRTFAPLNGLHTTPEIAAAFEKFGGGWHGTRWVDKALDTYIKANGIVKMGKTVGSLLGTWPRNLVAWPYIWARTGHLNPARDMIEIGRSLNKIFSNKESATAYKADLIRRGVMGQSVKAGKVRDYIADANWSDLDAIVDKPFQQAARGAVDAAAKAYGGMDDFGKIVLYELEKRSYIKAGFDEAEAADIAAEIVKSQSPTYERIPKAIRELRRMPLWGDFVSFSWTRLQNNVNQFMRIGTEMKDKRTKKIASRRLAGLLISAGAPLAAAAYSRWRRGITKQMENDMRLFSTPWSKNSHWYHLGDGKYIDLNYTDPDAVYTSGLAALMRGESVTDAVTITLKETFEPFYEPAILAKALGEVTFNKRLRTGTKIYEETDTGMEKTAKKFAHVAKAASPGTINALRRLGLAAMNMPNKYGDVYSLSGELISGVTGYRINKIDAGESLKFKAVEFSKKKRELPRKERGKPGEYKKARQIYDEFYELCMAARRLGVSWSDAREQLKAARISDAEAKAILSGRYDKYVRE